MKHIVHVHHSSLIMSALDVCERERERDLNDVHLELNGVVQRCVHKAEQRSKVLISASAEYQLLDDAERRTPTDTILDHGQDTASTATLTEHTYTHAQTWR